MGADKVVGPILLQRQCDGGKSDMSPEEWAKIIAARLKNSRSYFPGCGTVFQYWWGAGAMCPTCGRSYLTDMESLKRYRVTLPEQENDQDNKQYQAQTSATPVSWPRTKVEAAAAEQDNQDDQ